MVSSFLVELILDSGVSEEELFCSVEVLDWSCIDVSLDILQSFWFSETYKNNID